MELSDPTLLFNTDTFRHPSPTLDKVLSPNGDTMFSLHRDGSFVVWSVVQRLPRLILRGIEVGFNYSLRSAVLSHDGSFALLEDHRQLNLWNLKANKRIFVQSIDPSGAARSLFLRSPDRRKVFGSDFLFDFDTGKCVSATYLSEGRLLCASTDGAFVLQQRSGASVVLFRTQDGTSCDETKPGLKPYLAAFSTTTDRIFLSEKRALQCIDLQRTTEGLRFGNVRWETTLPDHIEELYVAEESTELFVRCEQRWSVHSTSDGTKTRSMPGNFGSLTAVRDGSIAVLGEGQPFVIGNLQTGAIEDCSNQELGEVQTLAISRSGRFLAWNNTAGVVVLRTSDHSIQSVFEVTDAIDRLQFLPDELHLCNESAIYEWSSGTKTLSFQIEQHSEQYCFDRYCINNEGTRAALWGFKDRDLDPKAQRSWRLLFLDLSNGAVLWEKILEVDPLLVAFSADPTFLWYSANSTVPGKLSSEDGRILRPSVQQGFPRRCFSIAEEVSYRIELGLSEFGTESAFAVCVRNDDGSIVSNRECKELRNATIMLVTAETIVACHRHTITIQRRNGEALRVSIFAPDKITAAVLSPDESTLYFGTGMGRVYRVLLSD